MEFILLAILTFGLCFLFDKGFTKCFRGKAQHQSGLAVRPSKRMAAVGIVMAALGIAAIVTGVSDSTALMVGGCVLALVGGALVVHYAAFGIFYDADSFILTTPFKKSRVYQFGDIRCQQLYVSYGSTVIELYMSDGRTVQLQSSMDGVYPFMDHAFFAWLRQTGRKQEECDFYDPENSCWFPRVEE